MEPHVQTVVNHNNVVFNGPICKCRVSSPNERIANIVSAAGNVGLVSAADRYTGEYWDNICIYPLLTAAW
jgi:hypothetical protein